MESNHRYNFEQYTISGMFTTLQSTY